MGERVGLREFRRDDESFLFSSWLTSFRSSPAVRGLRNGVYFSRHKAVVSKILNRESVRIVILCNADDEDQIYGWCVWEEHPGNLVLHYVYVKHFARGNGFMRKLLGEMGDEGRRWFSHFPASKDLGRWFEEEGFEYEPDLVNFVRLEKEG